GGGSATTLLIKNVNAATARNASPAWFRFCSSSGRRFHRLSLNSRTNSRPVDTNNQPYPDDGSCCTNSNPGAIDNRSARSKLRRERTRLKRKKTAMINNSDK